MSNTQQNIKIKVRNLTKSFGSHKVLCGIDLDVIKGRSLIILGGSGTGKSVLIKTIIGLLYPDSGCVEFDELDTTYISHKKRLSILKKCGFLFQGGALFDSMNVRDNITFFAEKLYNLNKEKRYILAKEKLESVGLPERILSLYPSELSGGMQKRVSLARAICTNPEIIFFDEPTTGLDPIMANVINNLIIKARSELGATTVTITHDIASARAIGQDVAMIYGGKIVWQGAIDDLNTTDNKYVKQFVDGVS